MTEQPFCIYVPLNVACAYLCISNKLVIINNYSAKFHYKVKRSTEEAIESENFSPALEYFIVNLSNEQQWADANMHTHRFYERNKWRKRTDWISALVTF